MVERHERLAEAIDIIQGLLDGEMTAYRGQHFGLTMPGCLTGRNASLPWCWRREAPTPRAWPVKRPTA